MEKEMESEVSIKDGLTETALLEPPTPNGGPPPVKGSKLEKFFKPWIFLLLACALALTQSMLVFGYISSIITTLELHFDLKSYESGLILSSNDMISVFIVIIVSYYGDKYNRARMLGIGSLFMCVGACLTTIPNFITPYKYGDFRTTVNGTLRDISLLCNSSSTYSDHTICDSSYVSSSPTFVLIIFMFSQMIIAFGACPVFTIGQTYLYDNVNKKTRSVYSAIMLSMAALGPALGFLMGAAVLSIYVAPENIPPGMDKYNPNWIGAWWIGYLICAGLAFFITFPLLIFPKELPNVHELEEDDISEDETKPAALKFGSLKDLGMKTWSLIRNKTWLSISFATVVEQSIISGFVGFMAKYFQVTFDFTATKANIITGGIFIPSAFTGIIFGGYIMKRFNFNVPQSAKFLMFLIIVPTLGLIGLMFLGCSAVPFAGITRDVQGIEVHEMFSNGMYNRSNVGYFSNMNGDCNAECQCSEWEYDPVCGSNGYTYYNPCFAGCLNGSSSTKYTSCGCITGYNSTQMGHIVKKGKCDLICTQFWPVLVVMFIVIFSSTCGQTPALMTTLRCVDADMRSFSLGIQNVLSRIIAFMPAPIYFGKIFDGQCLIWGKSCDDTGACLEYNTDVLPYVFFGTCTGLKILCFIGLCLTYYSSRDDEELKKTEMEETKAVTL